MAADWGSCAINDVASIYCLVPLFRSIVGAVTSLAGVALFIMILVGGFNFLFSGGDQKKLEAARGTITQAITGIVVMTSAYLIISLIARFTGVESITEFQIWSKN